ncbi:MAG: hypothetical protein ACXVCJ_07595 [Polyangiales bacterium]
MTAVSELASIDPESFALESPALESPALESLAPESLAPESELVPESAGATESSIAESVT